DAARPRLRMYLSNPEQARYFKGACSGVIFFFNDTATTEIYTLSLHDALPICRTRPPSLAVFAGSWSKRPATTRSEEHTSELQSLTNLVCRLLLEKKKGNITDLQPNAADLGRSDARQIRRVSERNRRGHRRNCFPS